jgi:hypothetical protein
MKRKLIGVLTVTCLLAISSLNSVAQQKKPAPTRRGTEYILARRSAWVEDSTFKVLTSKFARSKVVKGAPYSATATTEHIQTLSGGNQIIRKNESKMYRDSEGRTRIEQRLETIGKWTAEGEAPQRIFINDPVRAISYSADSRSHTMTVSFERPRKRPGAAKGEIEEIVDISQAKERPKDEDSKLRVMRASEVLKAQLERTRELADRINHNVGQKKTESLGNQTIEGVTAEGTRSTLTIPAGEIGNTLPLDIVDESWYSPELQVVVMTKHSDPRTGETNYRLTNINRSEPASSLFEFPDEVKVIGRRPIRKPGTIKEE